MLDSNASMEGCYYCACTGYEDYPTCKIICRIQGHLEAYASKIFLKSSGSAMDFAFKDMRFDVDEPPKLIHGIDFLYRHELEK